MTYQIGDPNHLGVHNDTVARIAAVAARGGIAVTLPDTAHLGDTGHVDDHNLIVAALAAIEAAPPGLLWAKVSGGTVTEYTHPEYGLMSVHTFTADGTLTVDAAGYADVLVVGGGAGCYAGVNGIGGDVIDGLRSLPAGPLAVTVGAGGIYASPGPSMDGKASALGSLSAPGGSNGSKSTTWTSPDGYPGTESSITGTAVMYGRSAVNRAAVANRGEGTYNTTTAAGSSGVVIVAVKKPAP